LVFESSNESAKCPIENIVFDQSTIGLIQNGKHLGNYISKNAHVRNIELGTSDFYGRVNMLLATFSNAFPWIKYKLFKAFCMPL
jgi:hypothetical protein